MLTPRLAQALALAIEAHDGQKRKGTQIPYVAHPMAVSAIALEHGANEDQAIAALLHDAVEDGGAPYAERIRQQFGDRVAAIVDGCTDGVPDANGHKEDWKPRKLRYITHLEQASDDVMLVSGADKLHNARAIVSDLQRIGHAVFERFTASRDETLWYYDELAKAHTRRGTPVAAALRQTVDRMKELAMIPPDLRQAFEETHYIVHHQPPFVLRIGQPSPALDALLQAAGQDCAVFITAWNPMAQALPEAENRARQQALQQELTQRGLQCIAGIGQHPANGWPGEESVLVLGLQAEAARALCGRYGQLACVVYSAGGKAELLVA